MTSPIKDTVRVNITNDTLRLAERGFGTTLIIDEISTHLERTKLYSDPAELLADGYSSTSEIYQKALILMSQARTPQNFMIGRRVPDCNEQQEIKFSVTPTAGTFKLGYDGNYTGDIAYDATAVAIKAALEALTTITEVTVYRPNLAEMTVEFTGPDGNKSWDLLVVDPIGLTPLITATVKRLHYGSAAEDIATGYQAIKDSSDDFFTVLTTSKISDADALILAGIVESETRFFMKITHMADVANTAYNESAPADFPSHIKNLNYKNTATVFVDTPSPGNYIDAAIIGLQLTKVPGSSTFMYKNLVGVSPATLTTQQRSNLRSKNCNFYETQGGRAIFKDGRVGSGEWIDIVIGIHYLSTRMSEVVYGGISIVEKVDFDTNGGAIVESLMFTALVNYGVNNNFISQDSIQIIIPNIDDIPVQEKAERTLKNVKFKAKLKGAIHIVEIDGSLSV